MNARAEREVHPLLWTELLQLGRNLIQATQPSVCSPSSQISHCACSRDGIADVNRTKLSPPTAAGLGRALESPSSYAGYTSTRRSISQTETKSRVHTAPECDEFIYGPVSTSVFRERYRWSPLEVRQQNVARISQFPPDISFECLCARLRLL
uniref:Uncharacterized protein n=1 Tax=viral metagenome TaxID=1070528 RepID=A0A6C0BZH4_9ZZZZ